MFWMKIIHCCSISDDSTLRVSYMIYTLLIECLWTRKNNSEQYQQYDVLIISWLFNHLLFEYLWILHSSSSSEYIIKIYEIQILSAMYLWQFSLINQICVMFILIQLPPGSYLLWITPLHLTSHLQVIKVHIIGRLNEIMP